MARSRQASAGRRRPRRPRFLNSFFPSWDFCFASLKFAHQPQRPWTKTRTGTRASIIQDSEDVDVLGSLGQGTLHDGLDQLNRCWWQMLETKRVGDNFKMLVTVLAISVINILYLLILALGTSNVGPISRRCHQHHDVTNMIVATWSVSLKTCEKCYSMSTPETGFWLLNKWSIKIIQIWFNL